MISYVIGFVLNMYLLVAKHYDEDFANFSEWDAEVVAIYFACC